MKNYTAMIASLVLAGASAAMVSIPSTAESAMGSLHPDKIEGKDLMDTSGKQLGDVDEVVKNKANQHLAVIGLEDSTKEVAIPVERMTMSADGKTLTTTMSREQLEALPDYDPMDMESVDE